MPRNSRSPLLDPLPQAAPIPRARQVSGRRRQVVLFRILPHRAMRGKCRRQTRHALPDPRDPLLRRAVNPALVKLRRDVTLELLIELRGVPGVPLGIVSMLGAIPDRPADPWREGL